MKPHIFWTSLGFDEHSFEDILKHFSFKNNLHPRLLEECEIVKKLVLHAIEEPSFLDEAYRKIAVLAELALKLKYREIEGKDYPKNKNFQALIKWATDKHLFENDKHIDDLRFIRNMFSHPSEEKSWQAPHLSLDMVFMYFRLFDQLYSDIPLRVERKKKLEQCHEFLNRNKLFENVVFSDGEQDELCMVFELVFYHNELSDEYNGYYFCGVPYLKNLNSENVWSDFRKNTFLISAPEVEEKENELVLKNKHGKPLYTISSFEKKHRDLLHEKWKNADDGCHMIIDSLLNEVYQTVIDFPERLMKEKHR